MAGDEHPYHLGVVRVTGRWLVILLVAACEQATPPKRVVYRTDGGSAVQLALLQYSYWEGGFDRPLFVAYSDGTIIFPTHHVGSIPDRYAAVRLTRGGVDSVLSHLGDDRALFGLDSLYDYAPRASDQHSFYLLLPEDSGMKLIDVRAGVDKFDNPTAEVPAPFRRLYSNLMSFSPSHATSWTPESVEVLVWPYEYAPDNQPLAWPSQWPGFESPRWHRRANPVVGEDRTIRLPYSDVKTLDSLLSRQRRTQAIGIGGHKWTLNYRWIFPFEDDWAWLRDRLES